MTVTTRRSDAKNVTHKFVMLHKPKQGADAYLELGFKTERCHREQAPGRSASSS